MLNRPRGKQDEDGDVRHDPGDIDIEERDEQGRTPIMIAARNGDMDTFDVRPPAIMMSGIPWLQTAR